MATEFEKLTITIEANTKQFERAMRSLDRVAEMRGVERAVQQSQARMEGTFARFGERMGSKMGEGFRRGLGAFLTLHFIRDALKAAADEGDLEAQHSLDVWDQYMNDLYVKTVKGGEKVAAALNHMADELVGKIKLPPANFAYGPNYLASIGKTQDRLIGDVTAKVSEQATYFDQLTHNTTTYVQKISELEKSAAGVHRSVMQDMQGATGERGAASFTAAQLQMLVNLEDEIKLLGMSADEQAVYNNQKAAGALLDKAAGDQIERVTLRLQEQIRIRQALTDANNALEDSSKAFVQGLLEGESAAEALTDALRRLADALLDMAFKSLFNPGGTPLLQTLFGGALGLGGNTPLGRSSAATSSSFAPNTSINVQGSVDQKTLGVMSGMIARNNARQNAELQRNWGAMQSRYSALRGP